MESEKIPDVPSPGSPIQVKEKPAARGIPSFPVLSSLTVLLVLPLLSLIVGVCFFIL